MTYLLDGFRAAEFESPEDMLTELQIRAFAQKLTSFVLLVMPDREYHPEQDKDDSEMLDEIQRLALDFVRHNGTLDEAYDTELVQKFIAWSHHEMILRVKKAFEIVDARSEQPIH